jgi:signal transduction histidine kinase
MFLAILAHDLRNPLNTIALSAREVSLGGSPGPDDKKALSQIETSAQVINRLITDLIDFASTGLGSAMPVFPAPMDLNRLVREVVREMRTAHPQRRIEFEQDDEMTIDGDAARLRQVVSNLLGNAIQHGSADVPITLTLAPAGGQSGAGDADVVLSVRNGGPPIPAQLLPTLFDPLVRGNVSTEHRRQGSIGLGLYIVREIVAAHRGSVQVTSSAAHGTEFVVRLPRRPGGRG